MSSDDIAIRVRNVSKKYFMFERPEDRLKQSILPRIERLIGRSPRKYYREFAALDRVTFDIKRGETVGIVGRNGSGKSTLLQIICGTLQPSTGTVSVHGRIAALLELGAGFNPEFTGRENVYMNGAILGLSRAAIDQRFDDIAAFADIGMFLDQSVKTYSSGMFVRLAFATAINVDPDILVVDEALAVGDEAFQRKCYARIRDIKARGATILFVSHGAQTIVQLCDHAMLIDGGELILQGRPKTVVSQYQRLINLSGVDAEPVREAIKSMTSDVMNYGLPVEESGSVDQIPSADNDASLLFDISYSRNGRDESWYDPKLASRSQVSYESNGARIREVSVTTLDGRQVNVLQSGGRYIYRYIVDFEQSVKDVGFGMLIKTTTGIELGGAATDFAPRLNLAMAPAGTSYEVRFDLRWSLNPGTYFLNAGVTGAIDGDRSYSHRLLDAIVFKVLPVEVQVATGYVDFDARPSFTTLE